MTKTKIRRPKALPGQTYEMPTACGPIYLTITRESEGGKLQELFLRFGKSGGCASAIADGMARIISYALRSGMEPSLVIKGLGGIGCHQGKNTCMHAIAKAFSEELELVGYDEIIPANAEEDCLEWG